MDNFFAAMEAVANNPTSQPERQVMLSEAETLANRFNYVDDRLSELAENMNEQMSVYVVDINRYAEDIAQLNQQIARLERTREARRTICLISVTEQSNRSLSWFASTRCNKTMAHKRLPDNRASVGKPAGCGNATNKFSASRQTGQCVSTYRGQAEAPQRSETPLWAVSSMPHSMYRQT